MDPILEKVTSPTNPNDLIGRNDQIDQFHEVLMEYIRSNPVLRWVHISGVAGVGKSSLLRKFRMMTEMERVATGALEVPISPKGADVFLTDLKQVIDEMAPEWRGFIQKYRNTEIAEVLAPPESKEKEVTDSDLKKIVDQFFEDLDKVDKAMKKEKMMHGIFLDDLDRFLDYNYSSILQVIPRIAKRLKDNQYDLLLVTTSHESANKLLDLENMKDSVLHLVLEQFDFNESELMIRRRTNLGRSDREDVIQSSTRYPFDLALRELIKSKELDPAALEEEVITKTFGFTSVEVEILKDLAKYEYNYFNTDEFVRMYSLEALTNLSNNVMIKMSQDGHFAVGSRAFWELISHVYKPIDPRTEAILILNRMKYQAELGQMPSNRDFDILRTHFRSIKDTALLFELSAQIAEAAKAALDGGLVQTAWDMLQLATLGLEPTEDYEKIADLQENLAKGFARVGHDYFAAQAFEAAGRYFELADIDWRSVTNYREAGQKYQRVAEDTETKIYHYAIRSMLKESYLAYINANEPSRAQRVLEDAQDLLRDYSQHVAYFKKLEVKGE